MPSQGEKGGRVLIAVLTTEEQTRRRRDMDESSRVIFTCERESSRSRTKTSRSAGQSCPRVMDKAVSRDLPCFSPCWSRSGVERWVYKSCGRSRLVEKRATARRHDTTTRQGQHRSHSRAGPKDQRRRIPTGLFREKMMYLHPSATTLQEPFETPFEPSPRYMFAPAIDVPASSCSFRVKARPSTLWYPEQPEKDDFFSLSSSFDSSRSLIALMRRAGRHRRPP